jgi:DNA-binding IclR family transcriptional regulator
MSRKCIERISAASFAYGSAARSLAASQWSRKIVRVTSRPVLVASSGSHALHARQAHALPAWWSAVWFARSPSAVKARQAMLVRLAASKEPGNFMALKPTMVERLLDETGRLGYGRRTPDFGGHFGLTRREWNDSRDSIALPILVGEEVIAALNLMWMHKVATVPEMVKTNLPHLTAAAREISRRLVATSH